MRHWCPKSRASNILGWLFIFWGMHKADYPFLRLVEWFAPYGYFIGSVFELSISVGIILLYIKSTRQDLIYAHKILRESEEKYRKLFNNANDSIYLFTLEEDGHPGKFIQVNDIACEKLGYSREEMFYMTPLDINYKEKSDEVKEIILNISKKGYSTFETIHVTKSGDEIIVEGNSHAFELGGKKVILSIVRDITERKKWEKDLQKNLDEAREFQQKLLPSKLPWFLNVGVQTEYLPAGRVGGDIYDVFKVDNTLAFFIADVSGKGVPAAMMSAYIKSILKHYINEHKITDPIAITNKLKDTVINENLFDNKFIAFFMGCIDLQNLEFKYVNAGECFPIIQRGNQCFYLNKSQNLVSKYFSETEYSTFEYKLSKGDRILFYTDGIYEWEENNGVFGFNKFMDYISNNTLNKESLDKLIEESCNSGGNHDDISYILLTFYDDFEYKVFSTKNDLELMVNKFINEVQEKFKYNDFSIRVIQGSIELIVNAFEHGNRFDCSKTVQLKINYYKDYTEVIITDEGDGFDWKSKLESPCVSSCSLRGRGIFLSKSYADEIRYNKMGNEVNVKFFNNLVQ